MKRVLYMMKLKTLFFGLIITSLFGCSREPTDNNSEIKGYLNSGFAWKNGSVTTCFLNTSANPARMSLYTEAIKRNFTKSSVGLEFTGFGNCSSSPGAQIKILITDPSAIGPVSNYVGTSFANIGLPYGASVVLAETENPFYDYNTAIHEFGHIAGLHHEHFRTENTDSDLCSRQAYMDKDNLTSSLPGTYPTQAGAFDRMSIMNYCVQGYTTQFLRLSDGDIRALRSMYKVAGSSSTIIREESVAELCNIVQLTQDVYAFSDESFRNEMIAGVLAKGTQLSRLQTKPMYVETPEGAENFTAIKAVVNSGPLTGKIIWTYGNATRVVGCKDFPTASSSSPTSGSSGSSSDATSGGYGSGYDYGSTSGAAGLDSGSSYGDYPEAKPSTGCSGRLDCALEEVTSGSY